jgi:hypothetical protein
MPYTEPESWHTETPPITFSTAGLTGKTAVWVSRERPVLDRSFNSLSQSARVRVSGFNPCLQDDANLRLTEKLLVEPWWGIHREVFYLWKT